MRQSAGFAGALASAGALLDEAQPAVENVRAFTAALADAQFRQDLHAISHNLAEITRLVSEGDGTVPRPSALPPTNGLDKTPLLRLR